MLRSLGALARLRRREQPPEPILLWGHPPLTQLAVAWRQAGSLTARYTTTVPCTSRSTCTSPKRGLGLSYCVTDVHQELPSAGLSWASSGNHAISVGGTI